MSTLSWFSHFIQNENKISYLPSFSQMKIFRTLHNLQSLLAVNFYMFSKFWFEFPKKTKGVMNSITVLRSMSWMNYNLESFPSFPWLLPLIRDGPWLLDPLLLPEVCPSLNSYVNNCVFLIQTYFVLEVCDFKSLNCIKLFL